jgi:hypothetical protein
MYHLLNLNNKLPNLLYVVEYSFLCLYTISRSTPNSSFQPQRQKTNRWEGLIKKNLDEAKKAGHQGRLVACQGNHRPARNKLSDEKQEL